MAIQLIPRDKPATYEEARERYLRLQAETNAAFADMLDCLARRQENVSALTTAKPERALLTVREAAEILGCDRSTVYDRVRQSRGRLQFVKQGSRSYLRRKDLAEYIETL